MSIEVLVVRMPSLSEKMELKKSLCTFLVFVFAFAYGFQSASSAENPKATRIHEEDASKYSSMLLSDTKTIPAIEFGNGMIFRLELEEPSMDDKAMNAARKAIGETPAVKEAAKKKLAAMLKNDSELNVPWENDAWLIRFLRLRNYDVPKTYKLIKSYYIYKEKNSHYFKNLVPSNERKIAEQGITQVLPNRDPAGSRIMLSWIKKWNPKEVSLEDVLGLGLIFVEASAYEPATQLAGAQIVWDLDGMTWQHIKQFNPKIAKLIVQWISTSSPLKIQAVHVINQPRIFSSFYNIFKPFLTDDVKSKVHFHGKNMKSLHQYIPATSLPKMYGGSLPVDSFSSQEWGTMLQAFDKEYAKLTSYGIKRRN